MKHARKFLTLAIFSLTTASASLSQAQTKPAPEGVTILIRLTAEGASRDASLNSLQAHNMQVKVADGANTYLAVR